MHHISIKPLSVNQAWRGRRFKTNEYLAYEQHLFLLLPKIHIPDGNLQLSITFGMSSSMSDIDNPLKLCIDILQKKYNFNDKRICVLHVEKIKVEKGKEYIEFDLCAV